MRPTPIPPGPGQESVWDYPRPAIAEPTQRRLQVVFGGTVVADTKDGYRTLETSHPPTYYIPPRDVEQAFLSQTAHSSFCEWKGRARYFDVTVGEHHAGNAAWAYPNPTPGFRGLADYIAFYPALMDACYVDGEQVEPQPGGFYGGWVTSHVVGPFKGAPGTRGW